MMKSSNKSHFFGYFVGSKIRIMQQETILIIDFGAPYIQAIAKRIRALNIYCEIHPFTKIPKLSPQISGFILAGDERDIENIAANLPDLAAIRKNIPVLALGSAARLLALQEGGKINPIPQEESNINKLKDIQSEHPLFKNIVPEVFATEFETAFGLSKEEKFEFLATNAKGEGLAFQLKGEQSFGLFALPKPNNPEGGLQLFSNFVLNICNCRQLWTTENFISSSIQSLKEQIGEDKVVLGLSGGVDSSVAAVLLHRAIGKQLHCIFVDNGLLRKNEFEKVIHSYLDFGLNVQAVDASKQFLTALKGITDPEQKRKAIGSTFIEVFDQQAHRIQDVKWLGQGTIYPDVIESASVDGSKVKVKSHHNVGGLPDYMKLKIVEPLRLLFKDEVRVVGRALGIPAFIIDRHPFPGPGLGVRILGEVTEERVKILQEVDEVFINGLHRHNLYEKVWQAAAILLPIQSVGVKDDQRTYENVVALRAVNSTDGMEASWSKLPYDFLEIISNEIIYNVHGVNRVVYDISSKPPATIEWE